VLDDHLGAQVARHPVEPVHRGERVGAVVVEGRDAAVRDLLVK
jgi:hypothetical protein